VTTTDTQSSMLLLLGVRSSLPALRYLAV